MSKINNNCLNAFASREKFKGPSCSVTSSVNSSFKTFNLYSYNLLIGTNKNGQISLLSYPEPRTPKLQGGSKTTRSLIKAAWAKFPNATILNK
jgi:hypothetical protein